MFTDVSRRFFSG